jgi:hypothetical protein
MTTNGQPTQNTQGDEERLAREVARQQIWLPEACPPDGSLAGKESEKPTRIVKIENSTRLTGPFSIQANTTEEIELFLKDYCDWNSEYIGLQFSPSPAGTMHRRYIQGKIDKSIDSIYVKLFLKKHPLLTRSLS